MKKFFFIITSLLLTILPLNVFSIPTVQATVGLTTYTCLDVDAATGKLTQDGWATYAGLVQATSADSASDTSTSSGGSTTATENLWQSHYRTVLCFDLASENLTSLENVTSVSVYGKLSGQFDNFVNSNYYYSLFAFSGTPENGYGGALDVDDYNNAFPDERVSIEVVKYDEYDNDDWIEFPIFEDNWADCLFVSEGYAYFVLAEANYEQFVYSPTWEDTKTHYINFYDDEWYLSVESDDPVTEREVTKDTNAAIDDTVTGFEEADNVTWGSPRCAYADEDLYFIFEGESGAQLDIDLVSSEGDILASTTNSIRVNDYYYCSFTVPSTTDCFVRIVENNHALMSPWGYISPSPSSSQETHYTYTNNTNYTQYRENFDQYVISGNEYFFFHWKESIQDSDLASVLLKIYYLGNSSDVTYSANMSTLADTYYLNTDDNDNMLAWRYAIFSFDGSGESYNDYDDIIIDLDKPFDWDTSGFYTCELYESGVSEITSPHSSAFYLSSTAEGIKINSSDLNPDAGEEFNVNLSAGNESKVKTSLNNIRCTIQDSSGGILSVSDGNFSSTNALIPITAPLNDGTYTLRTSLSNINSTFEYIYDITVSVNDLAIISGEDSDELLNTFEEYLDSRGWFTKTGKYIIILLLMAICYFAFRKSDTLKVLCPIIIFAGALIAGWIDWVVIVLLILGAGITLWGLLKNRLGGSQPPKGGYQD